jgi:two-component system response regulator AtoC
MLLMTDLLVLALIPDDVVRGFVAQTVVDEGHRLQSFKNSDDFESAIHRGAAPALILIEPLSNSDHERYSRLLQNVPESRICFLLKPGERESGTIGRFFERTHFLTKPVLRRDIEALLERAVGASQAQEIFGIDGQSKIGAGSSLTRGGISRPSELIIDEVGDNRYFLALSPAMRDIYRRVKTLEGIDISVLILGESGTGKEIIAHLLHKHSRRAQQRFVNVNCAALPADLLESELFGHVKGAFTGAIGDKPGRFEQSSGGTILLDEIGEISASMQAKLLHVLQDGEFTRLGAREPTKVDLRVLAATNISMEQALAAKTFREDLFYRVNTFTINVPPLRERIEEIPFLVNEMIWRTPPSMKPEGFKEFSSPLMNLLPLYGWPGNLRELRNFVTRTMILQDEKTAMLELEQKIDKQSAAKRCAADLQIRQVLPMRSLVREVKDRTETRMIEEALLACRWNRREAARSLNISYRALLYKIQQYRLDPRSQRLTG